MDAARLRSAGDFALRLAFFALVPPALVWCTAYFPLAGALFNVAFVAVVVVFAETVRRYAEARPWLHKMLRRQLEAEAYYRDRPSKNFVYYALYPLFFPYWLWNREARREFLLFKGYTIASFAILALTSVYQYFRYWRPELHFKQFAASMALVLLVDMLVTVAFLIPISTTVIHFSIAKREKALAVLLGVAVLSAGWEVLKLEHLRDPIVSRITRARVGLRTKADPARSQSVQSAALAAAWAVLDRADAKTKVVAGDGKVQGEPLDRARDALTSFYKRDEVAAFDLWATPRQHPELLILYSEQSDGHSGAIWLALRRNEAQGTDTTHDLALLPQSALRDMKHAASR